MGHSGNDDLRAEKAAARRSHECYVANETVERTDLETLTGWDWFLAGFVYGEAFRKECEEAMHCGVAEGETLAKGKGCGAAFARDDPFRLAGNAPWHQECLDKCRTEYLARRKTGEAEAPALYGGVL